MKLLKMANPVAVTKGAFGLAGWAVGLAETAARGTAHVVLSRVQGLAAPDEVSRPHRTDPAAASEPTDVGDNEGQGISNGPTIVLEEPHAPEEPPIDVVGQALAAEAALGDRAIPEGAGLAHEPRGSSRDEEHGDAPLQRAEVDGVAEEVAAALEGDVELEDDPDEPLLDPADVKAVAAEMEMSMRAADPHKG
jgi:hypothetical protein